jgi:hypothetical protein
MIQELKQWANRKLMGVAAEGVHIEDIPATTHVVYPNQTLPFNNWCRVMKVSSKYPRQKAIMR